MRVGENTTLNTVRDSLNRSRLKMNNLQKENSTLKRVNSPADDPVGNAKLMTIRNETLDNEQFERNASLAKAFLNYSDSSLEEITNLVGRAKELALGQASSAANGEDSRAMVAQEIRNIQAEVNSIANRRLGARYIFSGYKTNTQPFDSEGNGTYTGDDGKIMVEVQKDVFIGMNVPGHDVFLGTQKNDVAARERGLAAARTGNDPGQPELAMKQDTANAGEDIFRTLESLRVGLMTNDVDMIRSTFDPLDKIRDRVITTRAQIGARMGGIDSALANMGKKNVFNAELQSGIEDADVIQVVSDMAREESVLRASLQASNKLIQPTLLEFLR
ncbi:MAG TPA: flagellar hook-associated protein FlgL [Bdellovibrionota bacterium]|jgi:flagellar hook-associated protein 3 FlgL